MTNFPGEWWHWSWGEPGWALRTGRESRCMVPCRKTKSRRGRRLRAVKNTSNEYSGGIITSPLDDELRAPCRARRSESAAPGCALFPADVLDLASNDYWDCRVIHL
jgi:hypothetical protein